MSPLHPILIQKFRAAFGEPHHCQGKDHHWALRSLGYIAAVNVLINGSCEFPVVWVFDPHDPKDGVSHMKIVEEGQIDPLVHAIDERVRRAGRG